MAKTSISRIQSNARIAVARGLHACAGIALVACICPAAIAAKAVPRHVLTPDEIKEAFVGKVITDGYHWSALIQPDGSVKAVQMGRSRRGQWQIKGKEFCLALPKNSTFECWKVIRNKDGFVFNRFDQDQLDIKALPLTKDYDFN